MQEVFCDIHCHSTTKSFYTQRNALPLRVDPFKASPNNIQSAILNHFRDLIERVSEIKLGSQANFDALFEGGHRVVVVSITPPEKGFFILNTRAEKFITENLKAFAEYKRVPYEGTIKNSIINALTGFGVKDIANCKRTGLDYYHDLLKNEYEFIEQLNGANSNGAYTLRLVKNYVEIEACLQQDPNTLCVLLSVEGAHSLGKSLDYGQLIRNQTMPHITDQDRYGATTTSATEYGNNVADMKQWEYPPLFITFYHHLWNELGGHARSLNNMMTILINQEEGINLGINKTGKYVVKQLLSKKNGKRILIDIKHMSPRSRKDYYKILKEDEEFKNENIPIICSHTGVVTKRTTIEQMIKLADERDWEELEERFAINLFPQDSKPNFLHECSINLCAEDIKNIYASKGLVGLQLDEKRIAGKQSIKIVKLRAGHTEDDLNDQYAKILLANIFRIVQVINKIDAWDLICIGSDFDGLINHLDCCPTSSDVPKLKANLVKVLENKTDISEPGFNYGISAAEVESLLFSYTPRQAMDKVFGTNVMNFLKANF